MAENPNFREFQRTLMHQALTSALIHNEEHSRFWSGYKRSHEKVSEALTEFPRAPKVNCMVPIGKRALMKGQLIHTNEILACLGDGYFVRYSAQGAIQLCQRRIQRAEEMLRDLQKERDLYETRQYLPFENEVLGDDETQDITEFWREEDMSEWRKKHREKEREYHKRLSEVRQRETGKIESEEDLFARLDQLELEEELADELDRLNSGDNGLRNVFENEEDSEESDEDVREILEEELRKLEEIRARRDSANSEKIREVSKKCSEENPSENAEQKIGKTVSTLENISNVNSIENSITSRVKKSVSFKDLYESQREHHESRKEEEQNEEEAIRITFTHSRNFAKHDVSQESEDVRRSKESQEDRKDTEYEKMSRNPENRCDPRNGDEIESPADIFRVFSKPKSILKRSPNHIPENSRIELDLESEDDSENQDDVDERYEVAKQSTYQVVVKDIKERNPSESELTRKPEARPLSKFKRERITKL